MRIMQELGIAERILPLRRAISAERIPRHGWSADQAAGLGATAVSHRLGAQFVFDQPAFEHAIRRRLTEMPRLRILDQKQKRFRRPGNDGVWAEVHQGDEHVPLVGEIPRRMRRRKSARSGRSLGVALEDLGFDEPWLVVDLIVTDEKAQSAAADTGAVL